MRLSKLFLLLLVCVTIASVMAVTACWWMNWPRRTANHFASALASGNWEYIARILGSEEPTEAIRARITVTSQLCLEWLPRNTSDYAAGRQKFVIQDIPLTFTAACGSITIDGYRTLSVKTTEKLGLKLLQNARRVIVDKPSAVDVIINRDCLSEIVVVGLQPCNEATVRVVDYSGREYHLKIRVNDM